MIKAEELKARADRWRVLRELCKEALALKDGAYLNPEGELSKLKDDFKKLTPNHCLTLATDQVACEAMQFVVEFIQETEFPEEVMNGITDDLFRLLIETYANAEAGHWMSMLAVKNKVSTKIKALEDTMARMADDEDNLLRSLGLNPKNMRSEAGNLLLSRIKADLLRQK